MDNGKIKSLSFYGDGCLLAKFYSNSPVNLIGNNYGILYWESNKYQFGHESFTLEEIKNIVFLKTKSKKFKKMKTINQ